ncbi:YPDG domain-containing protein, partial [Histophilus somni]|uniref:YPDG domain-containing protein n=1 Tax=Histophilus somni TaxID=731 RepID=UPI00201EDECA
HRHINKDYMYIASLIEGYNIWSNTSTNNMFDKITGDALPIGPSNLTADNISNVKFAALAPNPLHEVLEFDTEKKFAKAGASANNRTTGLLKNHQYQQRWFKNGEPFGPVTKFTTDEQGNYTQSMPIKVEEDLGAPSVYTSVIYNLGDEPKDFGYSLASDSFIAAPDIKYDEVTAKAGKEVKAGPAKYLNVNGDEYTPKIDQNNKPVFSIAADPEKGITKINNTTASIRVDGVEVKIRINPNNGEIILDGQETAKIAGKTIVIPVESKYPNEFVLKAESTIKIEPIYKAEYEDTAGEPGKEVKSKPPVFKEDDNLVSEPEGTTFKLGLNAPKGAEIDPQTGVVTYTPTER